MLHRSRTTNSWERIIYEHNWNDGGVLHRILQHSRIHLCWNRVFTRMLSVSYQRPVRPLTNPRQTAATQLPRPALWQQVPTAIWLAQETAQRFAEDQAGCRFFGTERVHHQGHKQIPELWVMGFTDVTRECYTIYVACGWLHIRRAYIDRNAERGPTGVRSPLG
jgi:hypothetical protein